MRLDDLQQGQEVTILACVKNEQLSFTTTIEEVNTKKHCLYLAPILKDDKPISFKGSFIHTHLFVSLEDQIPHIFRNVQILLVRRTNNEICYNVTASTTSVKHNRRRHFRCYIGLENTFMVGAHRAPISGILKDISISGFCFSIDAAKTCSLGDMVHFRYTEQIPEISRLYHFNIYGIIVNIRELENGKILCGCRITSNTAGIESYIAAKERLRLQKTRINTPNTLPHNIS